jgi:hypothetical protein
MVLNCYHRTNATPNNEEGQKNRPENNVMRINSRIF